MQSAKQTEGTWPLHPNFSSSLIFLDFLVVICCHWQCLVCRQAFVMWFQYPHHLERHRGWETNSLLNLIEESLILMNHSLKSQVCHLIVSFSIAICCFQWRPGSLPSDPRRRWYAFCRWWCSEETDWATGHLGSKAEPGERGWYPQARHCAWEVYVGRATKQTCRRLRDRFRREALYALDPLYTAVEGRREER